jgi:hypothetical protein
VNAYNQGVGSLDARVLPQLRRLEEAGPDRRSPFRRSPASTLIVAPELADVPAPDTVDPPPAQAA